MPEGLEHESPSIVEKALSALERRTGHSWTDADLRKLEHSDLAHPAARREHPRGLDFNLRFPGRSNAAQGVLT